MFVNQFNSIQQAKVVPRFAQSEFGGGKASFERHWTNCWIVF